MYRRQQDHWGYVPNYAKIFSHRPEVMARWGRLLAEIRRPADDRRFELVTLAVSLELKHSACSLAHGRKLADIIGADNVVAIAEGREPEVLSEAEIAMLRFARDIARDARKITRGRVEELTKIRGFSDDEVFDIVAIASARCFFTKMLDSLGVEPDGAFMSMDPEFREKVGKGRPISHMTPEHLESATEAA
jgi:alkylhydroperoxidase family enzyme